MELTKNHPNHSIGDEPHHAPAPGQPVHKIRLLAVDDITVNCELISLQLQRHGYRVDKAYSGAEALALVEKEPFDLVLLDIHMPEMDGLEVLQRLRQKHSALELPVIMVTAEDQEESIIRALQMGANDYLVKPLNLPVALARIEGQLTLQRMATIKDDIVRFASHDLKKPLIVMLDIAQTLRDTLQPDKPTTADSGELLDLLMRTGHNMQQVISGFLDLEALRQGQIEPVQHAMDINTTVHSAIEANMDYAARKDITLNKKLSTNIPMVQANDFRLFQILDNLIGNALKYCPKGAMVEVKTGVDVNDVFVEIIDNGPGLSEEDFPKLFVKHAKLSNLPTGSETSSGVGLALCKQLITLDHGQIGARNNGPEHGGTTFWITLPIS